LEEELDNIGGGWKRALMDLGAKHRESSSWDNNWKNPRLDSKTGVHNHRHTHNRASWWEMYFNGKLMEVSTLTYKKRGGGYLPQYPKAVRILFHDHQRW
jgi:hypothetical protein